MKVKPPSRRGVTLVELMIAMAIVAVGIAGLSGAFSFIQKALQASKNRTLAANLAQEKMQIIKQKPYHQIIVTSNPVNNDIDFAPETLSYDTGYFPPERIVEGGVTYMRYTFVENVQEDAGEIQYVAANAPDTGMRRVTVSVVWGYATGGKRKVTLRTIMGNPDTVMNNSAFTGIVRTATGSVIPDAAVSLVEAVGFADVTDVTGRYRISATPGSYSLHVRKPGYFPAVKPVTVSAGGTLNTDFTLVKMHYGSIRGYPWLNNGPVISQVVGSSVSIEDAFDQEYVEIFNPTAATWQVSGAIGLKFRRAQDASKRVIKLNYVSGEVDAGAYYLFANTPTVIIGGVSVQADAVWSNTNVVSDFPLFASQSNIIPVYGDAADEGAGALELYRTATSETLDMVGWDKNGATGKSNYAETSPLMSVSGLSAGEGYFRKTSTADVSGVSQSYGPAYDSGNNSVDFYHYTPAVAYPPRNSFSGVAGVVSGKPAGGAVVTCTDGLSTSTEAVILGSPPYAYFELPRVATGYWSVSIASKTYYVMQTTVPVLADGSVYTLSVASSILSATTSTGFASGRVLNALGVPLNNIIVTAVNLYNAATSSTYTDSSGRYRLTNLQGTVNVVANPVAGGNPSYVNASSNSVNIQPGEMQGGVDFVLYQGGRITGFVSRDGINGLAGVSVGFADGSGVMRDVQVSDVNGRFNSVILSTGYYVAQPVLGDMETSQPAQSTVTITSAGGLFSIGTFTIMGAMGNITGTVRAGGEPVRTGVLIAVTTMSLAGTPPLLPDISSNSLTGPPIYMVSSLESGVYALDVRGSTSTTYSVYAYYPVAASTYVVVNSTSRSGITVLPGQTFPEVNFSW